MFYKKILLPLRSGGTIGRYNAPGAPDISGESGGYWANKSIAEGALGFSVIETEQSYSGGSEPVTVRNMTLAASLSNPIYGASSTVMPASADMAIGIYLGRAAEV